MKKFFIISGIFFCCCVIAALWGWREINLFLSTPPSRTSSESLFTVQSGATLAQVAKNLERSGLITSAYKFSLLARYRGEGEKLKAGRFILNKNWEPQRILQALVEGKEILDRVTIPEGLTWWQTGKLLEEKGFVRFEDFKNIVHDKTFLRHYGVPFDSAEGFLMPDTYLLKKPGPEENNGSPEEVDWEKQTRKVAGRLIDNFFEKTSSLWPGNEKENSIKKRPDSKDLKKWTILASIVEKETAIPSERKRVAGVYQNRLQRNMLLQADPTVVYGLGSSFEGQLLRKHLEDASNPYNTYKNTGLPPGPIASFGLSALKAAIFPENHGYLYFVAKTDGGAHNFSESLEDHNRAVRQYREQKKQLNN